MSGNIAYFKPYTEKHAIEKVVFGISFAKPLPEADIAGIISRQGEIESLLPFCLRQRGTVLCTSMTPFDSPLPRRVDVGAVFLNDPDVEKAWRFASVGDGIHIVYKEYSRWTEVFAEVRDFFKFALKDLTIQASNIRIAYNDVFIKDAGCNSEMSLEQIISCDDNPYLPPNGYIMHDKWRNSYLFCDKHTINSIKCDAWTEVRIEYGMQSKQDDPGLSIFSSHQYSFDNTVELSFSAGRDDSEQLDLIFEELHKKNKETFCNILSNKALQSINLQCGR